MPSSFGSVHTKDNQSKYMSNTNHAPPPPPNGAGSDMSRWHHRGHMAHHGWQRRHVPSPIMCHLHFTLSLASRPVMCCRHHPYMPLLLVSPTGVTPRRPPASLTHLTTRPPTLSIHPPAEFPSHPLACHPCSLLATCSRADDPMDVPMQTHEDAPPTHNLHHPPAHQAPAPNAQMALPHSSPSQSSASACMHLAAPTVSLPSGTHLCSASRMTPASQQTRISCTSSTPTTLP